MAGRKETFLAAWLLIVFGIHLCTAEEDKSRENEQPTVLQVAEFIKRAVADPQQKSDSFLRGPLTVGSIGGVVFDRIKILQIVDENNFRGEFLHNQGKFVGANRNSLNDFIKLDAWFRLSTKGLADGQTIEPDGAMFFVSGTKQYTTAGGSFRTVFVLDRIDQEIVAAAIRQSQMREWSDRSGKFKVVARFIRIEKGTVTLEKENGEIISFKLGKLSRSDQKIVRSQKGTDEKQVKKKRKK